MAIVTVTINVDNDAFSGDYGASELVRVLRTLAAQLDEHDANFDNWEDERQSPLWDSNGNRIGAMVFQR